jgi:hypothetical protein
MYPANGMTVSQTATRQPHQTIVLQRLKILHSYDAEESARVCGLNRRLYLMAQQARGLFSFYETDSRSIRKLIFIIPFL